MAQSIGEKIDTMLASVQKEVNDSEASFKLRTARQLLMVYDEQLRKHRETLDEEDIDEDALENLRKLGYLD